MLHSSASLSLLASRRAGPQGNIWAQLWARHPARSAGNTAMKSRKKVPSHRNMLWKEGARMILKEQVKLQSWHPVFVFNA